MADIANPQYWKLDLSHVFTFEQGAMTVERLGALIVDAMIDVAEDNAGEVGGSCRITEVDENGDEVKA